jgi:hypothetical protein
VLKPTPSTVNVTGRLLAVTPLTGYSFILATEFIPAVNTGIAVATFIPSFNNTV